MDLVTIVCERDMQDILLQAHSIDKFVSPCRHYVTIEDESLSVSEWESILSPHYKNHELIVTSVPRPKDLSFDAPFTLGWRRQQMLKLDTATKVESDRALVLDAKNIFVRSTDLREWPFKNSNGRYVYSADNPEHMAVKWLRFVEQKTGLKVPIRMPATLEAPFACTVSKVREAVSHPLFNYLFMQEEGVIPAAEWHYYYCFLDDSELDEPNYIVCPAIDHLKVPKNVNYETYIKEQIEFCNSINSPTHGLHRKVRKDMSPESKLVYENWLTSIGLDSRIVKDYVYFEMTDSTWGC